jgi:hypothetical protein
MPTILFENGWESGTTGGDGNVNTAVSSERSYQGTYSLRANPSAGVAYWLKNIGGIPKITVSRFWVFFATLPNADTILFHHDDGVGVNGVSFKQSDSKIYAMTQSVSYGATGVTVTTGQWYRIDVKVDASANPRLTDARVDGVALGQASWAVAATTGFTDFRIGTTSQANTWDGYFDSFAISPIASDYPINYNEPSLAPRRITSRGVSW